MSRTTRFSLLLIVVSTLAATAGYFLVQPEKPALPAPEAAPTADAPARLMALTLPDLDNRPQTLAQWKDKVLVVNFWATWCPPCKEEMPEFSRLNSKYASNGVQFVGISIDTADKVLTFQKETPVSYPLLISSLETLALSRDLGNRANALPFTVVLRRDGSVVRAKLGKYATPELEKTIQTALQPG
ncbi:MAG: TlpA family protein disulfide reductase [Betaproteobacteria bacterium]|nr:TlpA family protein disulfide reductase [Betaproteobacteria bacterium]